MDGKKRARGEKTVPDCEGREYGKQRSSLIEISFTAVVATASLMEENGNKTRTANNAAEKKSAFSHRKGSVGSIDASENLVFRGTL